MQESKMEIIKEWLEECPLLSNGKINVDYLDDEIDSYSIDRTPVTPVVKKFIDGRGGKYQINFDFTVQAPLSCQSIVNLANSKFCEDFQDWVSMQNRNKNFPNIDGAFSIECTSPRIYITKNRNDSNLYYTDELYVL